MSIIISMKNQAVALHDLFLNILRRSKTKVQISLSCGKLVLGFIKGFDNNVVIVQTPEETQLMLYRCNICTVDAGKCIL